MTEHQTAATSARKAPRRTRVTSQKALVGLVTLAAVALAGCGATATATAEAPTAWDSKTADQSFVRRAEKALAAAPDPTTGWRVGVILAEQDPDDAHMWLSGVLTPDGMVMVGPDPWASDCDDGGDGTAADTFPLMLDPGDLITWAGDSRTVHAVCAEDMRVLRKAAA